MLKKAQELNNLRDSMICEDICSDLVTQATQLVFGAGNPDADIVFIGEAPGKKEDETGLPFVGASGRFLNEMLTAANLNWEDVYITNIVKYRPPGNRDPSQTEKDEFWPYLMRQLEIIQPKVVVALGRHSGMCFIPDLVISRDHGKAQIVGDWLVVPLYHPAVALYDGSKRQVLIDDFLKAVSLAKSS